MPSFAIRVPSNEIRAKLRKAKVSFGTEQRPVLEAMGVRVLSFAKQDYVTKSRGGTGTDGIKWAALEQSTIDKRNRRGKANAKRKKTKGGKRRPTGGKVAIGIDTGLQLNSATPGYSDAGRSEPPKRTPGKNILVVTDKDVTVGFGRTYSKYYDEKRPLLPDQLPQKWTDALTGIVDRWAQKIIKGLAGG